MLHNTLYRSSRREAAKRAVMDARDDENWRVTDYQCGRLVEVVFRVIDGTPDVVIEPVATEDELLEVEGWDVA